MHLKIVLVVFYVLIAVQPMNRYSIHNDRLELKKKEYPQSISSQLMGYGNADVYKMKNYQDVPVKNQYSYNIMHILG